MDPLLFYRIFALVATNCIKQHLLCTSGNSHAIRSCWSKDMMK